MRLFAILAVAAVWAAPVAAQDPSRDADAASGSSMDLRTIAEAIDPLAQASDSEAAWQAVLDALRAEGGPVAEQAVALNRIGDARYYQQNFAGALETAKAALALLEETGETEGEAMAESLANAAVFYSVNGQSEYELPYQERSLAIRKRLYGEDPSVLDPPAAKALGLGYVNYASALYENGRFAEAADLVEPSIQGMVRGEVTDATLFVAMSSGANMLADAGRAAESLDLAQRGVVVATELLPPDHPFIGFAQATLAKILLQADRYEEAEEPARRALDIMTEKLGPDHRNTLTAMHNLGVIAAALGRHEDALALTLGRYETMAEADPGEGVISLVTASNVATEMGNSEQSLSLARQAAALAETLPEDNAKAARGLETLAMRLDEMGDYSGALELIDDVIARRQKASGDAIDPASQLHKGLLLLRLEDREAGWPLVQQGLDVLEADLVELASQAEIGGELSSYYEVLTQVAEAAIIAGEPDTALRAFELASWGVNARARQFVTLRAQSAADPALAALVDTFQNGRSRLRLLNRERAALLARDDIEAAAEREREIATETERVASARTQLAANIDDFDRWLRPEMPSVADLQARMGSQDALLVAMPARHRTFVLAITQDGVAMHEATLARSEVRRLVDTLRASLEVPNAQSAFPVEAAVALHDAILPPDIAALLADKSHVALVTSDALSRLPFGILLPAADQKDLREMDWLARHHAFSIALTPSDAFRKEREISRIRSFLGVGAPILTVEADAAIKGATLYRNGKVDPADLRTLPALPETANEVAQVAASFAGTDASLILLGEDATEPRVRTASATQPDIILFATHGLLGGEMGGLREPALVLTPPDLVDDPTNDGLLLASEIAQLGFAARFVVLSACNSAAGRAETSPPYTGLANAFLGSGSETLMLSHWRVRDDAAARLTIETTRRVSAGIAPSVALQQAQLSLMADESMPGSAHPATWAPFVIIGE
ncbi:CHAT domain-containing protein [Alteriqipengyuania sp.]|uniref:CHAT domain-containing tetratricopeptide repeat protein n=1 Tax=Alteriqipengyuania sp. TaxID=2800692 RepID=UPI00351308D2